MARHEKREPANEFPVEMAAVYAGAAKPKSGLPVYRKEAAQARRTLRRRLPEGREAGGCMSANWRTTWLTPPQTFRRLTFNGTVIPTDAWSTHTA